LTAIILQLVLEQQLASVSAVTGMSPLVLAISAVGVVAIIWTMLGGIATVVWTDAMLFLVFVVGGLVALGVVASQMPDGLAQVVRAGWAAGKFKLWELSVTPANAARFNSWWAAMLTQPYTIWAAIFAVTFGNIGSYGTDQLLAQRIFTCRNQRDAKWAVISSWTAELVVALMLMVGVGLWSFYKTFPEHLSGAAAAAVEAKPDNIFPVFILTQVPVALRGLFVAGIFAAAISSLTSILAALSQTTLSAVYLPLRGLSADQPIPEHENQRVLTVSRILIVVWGIALCAMAVAIDGYVEAQKAKGNEILFLDLALGLANYIIGTLFAAFLLAWLPLGKDGYGLIWSAPLSVFCVVATRFHTDATLRLIWLVSAGLIFAWIIAATWPSRKKRRSALLLKTGWLALGCGLMLLICARLWFAEINPSTGAMLQDELGETLKRSVAWPWYAPVGGTIALVFGYLLGEPKKDPESSPASRD
jgi:Na+/proline symporter